jgi:hypothetical protein
MNNLEILFIVWGFLLQIVLIIHFALRRWFFDAYIMPYGWVVYALGLPSAGLSLLLIMDGKAWWLAAGGLLYMVWAAFGFTVEYIRRAEWRSPIYWPVFGPYITLYLAAIMFYWWPIGMLYKPLWHVYAVLFVASTILNLASHKKRVTHIVQGRLL